MKIAYILPSLESSGGAERIITEKANYFSMHFGYEVTIITLFQRIESQCFYPLHEKVRLINLHIPYYTQYQYKYPKRLWVKLKIYFQMRKELSQTISSINPDFIIGVSYSKADLVCTIPSKAIKIIECHEPRALKASSVYNGSFISKLYTSNFYFKKIEKNADIIITLNPDDKKEWKNAKRVEFIPNFSSMPITGKSTCKAKRVIAVGRLRDEKGFDRLIDIWKMVSTEHPFWMLDMFGEGPLKSTLENQIKKNNISNIILHGATSDISKEYANSSICAVTSHFEGFSLVILEAMRHGVPCVAFDCPFGPRSIIKDSQCGFLVDNGDTSLFAERLCCLIKDEELRKRFSKSSIERASTFEVNAIMNKWKVLLEELNCAR